MIRHGLNNLHRLSTKDFKKIHKLGEGANSIVYNVRSLNDNKIYTCKEYNIHSNNQVKREEYILNMIRTENEVLTKYYMTIMENGKTWLLTEYIEGDDLFTKYCKETRNIILTEITIKPILNQMIDCIDECNKNNIIHMDIKPENFIISYDNKISLIDFGCSYMFNDKHASYDLFQFTPGTCLYCAYEVIYKNTYHINSDIWSLGVCIYGLLKNVFIFNINEIANPNEKYDNLDCFSPELQDLLKRIFVIDPEQRIYLEDIKKHPYITNTNN